MSDPLNLGGHDQIDAQVVTPSETDSSGDPSGRFLNGAGEDTAEYNDTDGDANGETFIKTDLGRVDVAQVTIDTNDASLSASAVGVVVADARPAVEGDFDSAEDFEEGTIHFTLVDEDGSGEISNDTAIESLDFSYVAVRK